MFSNDRCHKLSADDRFSVDIIASDLLRRLCEESNSCGGIVITYDQEVSEINIVASYNIQITTYKGAQKDVIKKFLKECYQRYPAPHVHNMKKTEFWLSLSSVCNTENWCKQSVYYPVFARNYRLIILLYYPAGHSVSINGDLSDKIDKFVDLLTYFMWAGDTSKKLETIELYVKEVGHDIASSVQAIVAKLRAVSSGRIQGDRAITKVVEAEEEIMSAYRIADALGITVDPDYNINSEYEFNFYDVVEDAIKLCKSEARERHIDLKISSGLSKRVVFVLADEKAIKLALIQMLMNAIKYAKGATDVIVNYSEKGDFVKCDVMNIGYGIDDCDQMNIWDFGYRGNNAKEMHVNGSGIGLYTVKKIIKAHSGFVGLEMSGAAGKNAKFYFNIPRKSVLMKRR